MGDSVYKADCVIVPFVFATASGTLRFLSCVEGKHACPQSLAGWETNGGFRYIILSDN